MKIHLVIFLILIFPTIYAQNEWPPKEWKDTSVYYKRSHSGSLIPYQKYKGYLVTTAGDTLTGYMEMVGTNCIMLGTGRSNTTIIPSTKVNYIRIEAKSLGRGFVEISTLNIKHHKNSFWRLIKKKYDVAIYDLSVGVFLPNAREEFSSYLYLITKNEKIKIYGDLASFLHGGHEGQLILKFINKRYKQSLQENYFKTEMDMIDYILNKENEIEKSQPK